MAECHRTRNQRGIHSTSSAFLLDGWQIILASRDVHEMPSGPEYDLATAHHAHSIAWGLDVGGCLVLPVVAGTRYSGFCRLRKTGVNGLVLLTAWLMRRVDIRCRD